MGKESDKKECYSCKDCDYDLCKDCYDFSEAYQEEKKKKEQVDAKNSKLEEFQGPLKTCRRNHPLKGPMFPIERFCDICGNCMRKTDPEPLNVSYSCPKCDFDVCKECYFPEGLQRY